MLREVGRGVGLEVGRGLGRRGCVVLAHGLLHRGEARPRGRDRPRGCSASRCPRTTPSPRGSPRTARPSRCRPPRRRPARACPVIDWFRPAVTSESGTITSSGEPVSSLLAAVVAELPLSLSSPHALANTESAAPTASSATSLRQGDEAVMMGSGDGQGTGDSVLGKPTTRGSASKSRLAHSLVAQNDAVESENKIHDDAVARKFGFEGGLVPGVTVFGYLTWPAVAEWGKAWLESGRSRPGSSAPVYDGDHVEIVGEWQGADLKITACTAGGERATAVAGMPDRVSEPLPLADFPNDPIPPPDARPPASPEVLGGHHARSRRAQVARTTSRATTCCSCPTSSRRTAIHRLRIRGGCCEPRTTCCRGRFASGPGSTSRAPCRTTAW